ncbi:alpha-L-rhamnosidase C-terminal domain-containing protein [Kutzneria albida]|uniref:Alpha-L-rhamnosidase n=1 Tax=Kutzneria albida DSM 43870 TaxID=1449976 RepID=W5WG99_9PSEU|nr:alpha-L-rhamnosidase C-terminal domain-containing protein [Kutzneria albida]AHH99775.1 hypothetical protein KALB_6416 [Kutzneria albida DSM 43870]
MRTPLLAVAVLLVATAVPAQGQVPSWQRYVIAPGSRDVHPVATISTTGDVSTSGGTTVLRKAADPVWPRGTTAAASSTHAPNPRDYSPANAVDGDSDSFWNDDTENAYPDALTITAPSQVSLPGITLVSNSDGAPRDFTVETWDGTAWRQTAAVTGNEQVRRRVPFARAVSTTQVRITVTRDNDGGRGIFTRVNEVLPGLAADPPSIVLDFGKVVAGYAKLAFSAASGAPTARLAFAESTQYLTDRSDFARSDFSGGPGVDTHSVTGPGTWSDNELHGFRYLKISTDRGELAISSVSLDFAPFLGTPETYTGWFESSDQQLNQFWYNASYTNELCTDTFRPADVDPRGADSPSLRGKLVLHDGAKRDRDPYVGDLAVSGRTAYLTHEVKLAARNVLADLAEHQRADGWIPPASINNYTLPLFEYPLWWTTASWDYVLYTGDTGYGATYYPNLVRLLDNWYQSTTNARGLLARPEGYGDYAFLPRTGEVTYYNALYVQALRDAARLAGVLGHAEDQTRWQHRADTVSAAINTYLWDPANKSYVDSSTGPLRHGQDGNALAITSGVADPARARSALDLLTARTARPWGNAFMDDDTLVGDGSQRVYAFTSYPEIEARFLTGQADSAAEEIKRLYGWMGSTDWEGIGAGGSPYEGAYTSLAHGWSTGVLPALTNDLLGVRPTSPGFATWSVAPHPGGGVTWARGQVPTPHGPLTVSWHTDSDGFTLTVTAPPGTTGTVTLPSGTPHSFGSGTNTLRGGTL